MDDRRFDSLAKAIASGASRRSVLKGVLGLSGAAIAGATLLDGDTDAARRPTPTPKPVKCPGNQVPVGGVCTCPGEAPFKCGPACCTGEQGDPPTPGHTECCDNACCHGTCYGEELCCPTNPLGSEGQLPPLAELCLETNQCCLAPDFCCSIDGCCSTVCWGGNFDEDFCCPAEDLCPGGGSSADLCCTGDTTCCGAGTDENTCIDPSLDDACCTVSDCGPPAEGTCGWDCRGGQCVSFICVGGSICCHGACVSTSDYEACPTDPNECCSLETDVCCGEACCASTRCNAGQQCCGASQFVCGQSCCDMGPGATCCGGNTCCTEENCAGGSTCCIGSEVACGDECCAADQCVEGQGCCPAFFVACGGSCCNTAAHFCNEEEQCVCNPGTEACSELPGGCCPTGQCNDAFQCCATGTIPCGVDCCDGQTQQCNSIGSTCECLAGLIPCNGSCLDASCCGDDNALCADLGYDLECVACSSGECATSSLDFQACGTAFHSWCSNGQCQACIPYRDFGCTYDNQCCEGSCLGGRCDNQ